MIQIKLGKGEIRAAKLFIAIAFAMASAVAAEEKTRVPARVVNVCDLGAVPDGKTNSTRAIQKAIRQVAAKGSGRVFLPPGNLPYLISGTVVIQSDDIELFGPGASLQVVDNANDGKGCDAVYIGGTGIAESGHPPSPDLDFVAIFDEYLSAQKVLRLHTAGQSPGPRVIWSADKSTD
jgi:hypothetical protein